MNLIPCTKGENKLSAAQVVKWLFENIVGFFKVPKELVYGRDLRFTIQSWRELWHILGTKTSTNIVFHTQSDGQSECTNHTLNKS